ncbi:MAG: exodeoxyribonuclease III [Pseudomonadota bacterium]
MIKIATWNINSVRLRQGLVCEFLAKHQPDILCLQETKVEDRLFPQAQFESIGYRHFHFRGQKSYNGVAFIANQPLTPVAHHDWCGLDDTRHLVVQTSNQVEIHNFYIPAGGDIPDVEKNPKFAHKLKFVDEFADWFITNRKKTNPIIALGDFNIAPSPQDVWSHKQLLDVVSHTPIEVEKLKRALESFEWHDLVRRYFGEDQRLYSWWSYRARDWQKSNRGRRLDHIWGSNIMAEKLTNIEILKQYRGAERPSDHVPVMASFNL